MKVINTTKTAGIILGAFILFLAFMPVTSFAGKNIPVNIEIPVTYIVNGNDEKAGGDKFTLVPDDPNAPMPGDAVGGKKTITIGEEGSYSFGSIHFDRPEVWWYTVTRDITEKEGVTKDNSVYRVKVIALNDGHGYVLAYLEGRDEKHELTYEDRVAPETGDHNSLIIYAGLAFSAAAALILLEGARRKNRKEEA